MNPTEEEMIDLFLIYINVNVECHHFRLENKQLFLVPILSYFGYIIKEDLCNKIYFCKLSGG